MKNWFNKNKVFLLGLLSAIAVAVTPLAQSGEQTETVKWSTFGFAVLLAALGFVANQWRGQGLSITGIIGNAAGVIATLLASGSHVNTQNFIIQLVIQLLIAITMAAGADPKSRGYEQTEVIRGAKIDGEVKTPAALTNSEIKEVANEIRNS